MPSCLAKILGAFSIQIKNHSTNKTRQEYILINENLTYKQPKTILIYDLKGTINKRRKVQEGDEKTKMDLNYVEFTEGLPIILQAEDKKRLDAEIWNDTLFLSQQNIVDYSLLLILNIEKKVINYGIIDYMEQYTFERAIESKYKSVVGTEIPTIIYPKEYKNRFRQHMIQMYFMSVE
jgi:1-phosphatidylinositol-3-phosphate 5-kinase